MKVYHISTLVIDVYDDGDVEFELDFGSAFFNKEQLLDLIDLLEHIVTGNLDSYEE